ncbi:MAG: hypothetical protein B6I19_11345 [Bacteroidetes bacterium 4572_114]|nr:MAG: hypothetical protein B6I19_11345 [Bacteroidetes bacterium 4572_114]
MNLPKVILLINFIIRIGCKLLLYKKTPSNAGFRFGTKNYLGWFGRDYYKVDRPQKAGSSDY